MSFFFLSAFLGAAKFASTGSKSALWACLSAVALALGTKVSGIFLVAAVAPWLVYGAARHVRAPRWPWFIRRATAALALFFALGGVVYARNVVRMGRAFGQPGLVTQGGYGAWPNVWRFPELLFLAPFSTSPNSVRAPWDGRLWFWQRYDLYSSTLGALTTLLVLALPFAMLWIRRLPRTPERTQEMRASSIAALVAFFLVAPVKLLPLGFFCTFTRFVIFVVPIIAAWTVVPAVVALGRVAPRFGVAMVVALTGLFGVNAVTYMKHDFYAPLSWVEHELAAPDGVARFASGRACTALDRLAGANDSVAIDSDFDSWIYACWGTGWTRKIAFIHPGTTPAIPHGVKWVVVDRSWGVTWNNPNLTDFGHFFEYIRKGTPTPDELSSFRALGSNREFRLVFHNRELNQAVFERIHAI
jgi:hypothetical protein